MRFALLFALAGAATAQISSSDIQRLLSGLSRLQQATDQLTTAVSQATNPSQAAGILSIVDKIKNGLNYATGQVNQASGTPTDAQQAQIFQATEQVYPSIIKSLDATVAKAPLFKQYGFSSVVASQLQQIQTAVDAFSKALIAKTTGAYTSPAEQFESIVDDAFSSALATQAPSSMALPSIPAASGSATSAAATSTAATSAATTSAAATSATVTSDAATMTGTPSEETSVVATKTTGSPVVPAETGTGSAAVTSAASPTGGTAPPYTGAAEKLLANVGLAAAAAAAALAV